MNRADEAMFVLWHVFVLGLAAIAVVLGWSTPLLASGREIALGLMCGLYALGVCLSAKRIVQFRRGVHPDLAQHQLEGIALVGNLLVTAGLGGTVAGLMLGTEGITGASAADAGAAGGMVGTFIGGLGLALSCTLVGIALNSSIRIGARFVSNVAFRYAVSSHAV